MCERDIDKENDRNSDFNDEIAEERWLKHLQAEEEAITQAWYE